MKIEMDDNTKQVIQDVIHTIQMIIVGGSVVSGLYVFMTLIGN